jgi:XTP/dITP diphosphohydrolase
VRPARRPLVVATGNPGKLRELGDLLAELPYELLSQASLGVVAPPETESTFVGNALLKARHAAAASAHAALADDSGLEVDALGGAPGVYSARFAGAQASDADNNAKLIAALAGVSAQRRTARYRCVLAFVEGPDDPQPLIAEGVWEGEILEAPRGHGGFGYDPLFWVPALGCSAAELSAQRKNALSHRACALKRLRELLRARSPGP